MITRSAEAAGSRSEVATGLSYTGLIFSFLGLRWLANRYYVHAAAIAEDERNPMAIGHVHFAKGMGQYHAGRLDGAMTSFRQSAEAFLQIGHLRYWGGPMVWTALTMAAKGDTQCQNVSRELLRAGSETRDQALVAWGLHGLGISLRQTGTYDQAIGQLEQAAVIYKAIPDHHNWAYVSAEMALCLALKGSLDLAVKLAGEVEQSIRKHRPRGMWAANPSACLAEVFVLALHHRAPRDQHALFQKARNACRDALRYAKACKGEWAAESLRVMGTFCWITGNPARAEAWWDKAARLAEEIGTKYSLAQICLERGRRLERSADVQRAEALFAQLGIEYHVRAAGEVLASLHARDSSPLASPSETTRSG